MRHLTRWALGGIAICSCFALPRPSATASDDNTAYQFEMIGKQCANEDARTGYYYAYNDFRLPLWAHINNKDSELLKILMSNPHDKTAKMHFRAFVKGYRSELHSLRGNYLITRTPLIVTYQTLLTDYAQNHEARLPKFHNADRLYAHLKSEYFMFDPYAGMAIHYGINTKLSGQPISSQNGKTILLWVMPSEKDSTIVICYANGEIDKISRRAFVQMEKYHQVGYSPEDQIL